MFRGWDGQKDLFSADNIYLDIVGADSFYAFLAREGYRLFPDEKFATWYVEDNGRPCVSPCLMTKVLLLQMYDRCSDAEAVQRAMFDLRWKVALCIRMDERPFGKSTLQDHRARIHLNNGAQEFLIGSVQEAKRMGVLKGKKIKAALDTTPVFGRGAVKDTYNLVADGIKALCRALGAVTDEKPHKWAARHDLSRYFESSSLKGEADIDWSSEREREVFLRGLVVDVDRLLMTAALVLKGLAQDNPRRTQIREASALLERLVVQDVERDGKDGPRIKQEVAKDRIPSVHDPEMRHGRKSASKRFDGHKLAIAVEPESQIITALEIKPGNASDAHEAINLVEATERATGAEVEKTIGDCAYGDGATRQAFKNKKRQLVAKVPSPPKDDAFNKAHFQIDLDNSCVTCPAGQTTNTYDYVKSRDGKDAVKFFRFDAVVCAACPFVAQCVKNKKKAGRTVTLHPQEKLLQEARAYQKTDEFLEDKRARQSVEHRIARLIQLGVRQARYFGRAKTRLQCVLAAVVANLMRVMAASSWSAYVRVCRITSSILALFWSIYRGGSATLSLATSGGAAGASTAALRIRGFRPGL